MRVRGSDIRVILLAERQADTTRSLPGYLRWERTGIRVRADQCHVTTVQVTADLRREG